MSSERISSERMLMHESSEGAHINWENLIPNVECNILVDDVKKLNERITNLENLVQKMNIDVGLLQPVRPVCFICKNDYVLVLCCNCTEKVCINCSINRNRKSSTGQERCFHYCIKCK